MHIGSNVCLSNGNCRSRKLGLEENMILGTSFVLSLGQLLKAVSATDKIWLQYRVSLEMHMLSFELTVVQQCADVTVNKMMKTCMFYIKMSERVQGAHIILICCTGVRMFLRCKCCTF